jgi:iron complex outermembrane receptor protein
MVANSYAAFGEATYAVTPTTFVTGGVRYTSEKRRLEASQIPINQTSAALIAALTLVGRTDHRTEALWLPHHANGSEAVAEEG